MIRIGSADISMERREAFIDGSAVQLGGKAFDLLGALLERQGSLVTKQTLMDAAWPDVCVEENNVHVQISALRRALRASKQEIETVPRRGYRLNLPVPPDAVPGLPSEFCSHSPVKQPVIYVVDDDLSVRNGLLRQLRAHGLAAVAFESAEAFLEGFDLASPGCLLLDMNLKHSSGLDLQSELSRRCVPFPVIFITGAGTIDLTVRAMKGGAQTLLVKPFDPEALLSSVQEALDEAPVRFESQARVRDAHARFKKLTSREVEIFDILLSGAQSKAIAAQLGVSEVTIKVHKKSVMSKLQASSVVDLYHLSRLLGRAPLLPEDPLMSA